MFKSEMLPKFVSFILMFYKHKPVDWLLDNYFWVQECQGVSTIIVTPQNLLFIRSCGICVPSPNVKSACSCKGGLYRAL